MAQKPQADPGLCCPLYRKDVSKVCHKCAWYEQIRGMNPQTGDPVDRWSCAIALLPILTIENSNMQRQTGAAINKFHNDMNAARAPDQMRVASIQPLRPARIIDGQGGDGNTIRLDHKDANGGI